MGNSDFSFLFSGVKKKPLRRLVVANGVDEHSLEAVFEAVKLGIVDVILTGDERKIHESCKKLGFSVELYRVVHCDTEDEAVTRAVEMAKNGEANLIMKGLTSTDKFMKAILNKERGILPKGNLLSHVTMVKNPAYHKPLLVSDVAIIPLPDYDQKVVITQYLVDIAHKVGIEVPNVAFIAATEKVIEKIPACYDANKLKEFAAQGGFGDAVCEGPIALDVAIDKESARIKGINSAVAGNADCLLFPNIETGNVFYKLNTKLCKSETAAIVVGTDVPTVLSSRGDTTQTKLNSIAFAAMIG